MLSLMWGTGWPALYSHDNLAEVTHRRGGDLYGATSMHYYRHVAKMLRAGSRPVKYDMGNPAHAALPDDYFAYAREIDTPVLLTTGEQNDVFTDSNIVCYERLRALGCDWHELKIYPGYGHQDVFMGEHVARDCFPDMLDFIRRHGEQAAAPKARKRAAAVPAA
jgi:lysosomal acid lipase/cholesteryl ester hydrolase